MDSARQLNVQLPALPLVVMEFSGLPVRCLTIDITPYVLAADAVAQIEFVPLRIGRTPHTTSSILQRVGLGPRERFGAYIRAVLGVPSMARWVGAISAPGIHRLRPHAPKFCEWVEGEAFPRVMERIGSRDASLVCAKTLGGGAGLLAA